MNKDTRSEETKYHNEQNEEEIAQNSENNENTTKHYEYNENNSGKQVVIDLNEKPDHVDQRKDVFGFKSSRKSATWVMVIENLKPVGRDPEGIPLEYDPKSRNGFVRTVFLLVGFMLLVTASFTACVLFTDLVNFFRSSAALFVVIGAFIVIMSLHYAIICSHCSRKCPCSGIVLTLTVICWSVVCAFFCARYRLTVILYAVLATAAVMIVCFILALTSFDFTSYMIYFIVIGTVLSVITVIVVVTMMLTGHYMPVVHLVILVLGALFTSVMMIVELQMILGGKQLEINEDDYALAAYLLYTSIIDVFLKMLQIIGIISEMN